MLLTQPIATLPKVGPKLAKTLEAIGIRTIEDLLLYFPTRYLDFSKFTNINSLSSGEVVTVRGIVKSISARFSFPTRKMLAEAIISDTTGSLKVTWFNQSYVAEALKKGDEVLLSGKVDQYKNILQLTNPIYEKVAEEHIHTGRLVPVYRLPEGVFPKTFRNVVHIALPAAEQLEDIIPAAIREYYAILGIQKTVTSLHFPESGEDIRNAQERLAFAESLIQQLAVAQHKVRLKNLAAPSIPTDVSYVKSLLQKLPFELTNGQKKALWTILQDLEHKHPMNRLLQGDVGSGKTIVAILSAMQTMRHGHQVALLVPTEVLAKQHYDGVLTQFKTFGIEVSTAGLYTRNFHQIGNESVSKKEMLTAIAQGPASLVIGTHALLQEGVMFRDLALAIIDEQHRFGVEQRQTISGPQQADAKKKGTVKRVAQYPHLLSMSATPIPRTAALTLYGDLEITSITEAPKNRLPIKTWVVPEEKRSGAYAFITKEILAGRQAFVITPLVEESTKLQAKAAKKEFERLATKVFPKLRLGLVYGSMKGSEKDSVMLSFKEKRIDILVATSVIEIGIDIPNASVIIIEDADRFGLAQLHQLRGRVGRGAHQSYCFLFSENRTSSERLDLFARTLDGFALAEYDMDTRGFGSLFGANQTGFDFKYGQYLTLKVLEKAKRAAEQLTAADPDLKAYPQLQLLSKPLSEQIHLE